MNSEHQRHPVVKNHIFCMIGKSASGKDTLFRVLAEDSKLSLVRHIPCTTRPIREGEQEGREYHFYTVDEYEKLEREHRIIEARHYNTKHGIWHYFTADDGQIDLAHHSSLMIGTPESVLALRKYYGKEEVIPIYVEVEDGERLARALQRERMQKEPKFAEMCRRFLADSEDFSEMKLQEAGVDRRFENDDFERCLEEIRDYIAGFLI